MANTSFYGLTGTTAEVQDSIQTSVDAAALSATNSATSETNSAASKADSEASAAAALVSKNASAASAAAALVSQNAAAASASTAGNAVTGALPKTGGAMTGAITTNSTVDGRNVSVDGTKLDTIEASATADQTSAQIKTSYESNSNTNAFTDALQSKLNAVEASADVTDTANVVASLTAGTNITIGADGTIASTASGGGGGSGDLLASNNLSDVANAGTARTNLGVAIGSNVQAYSSVLAGTTASFTTTKDSKLTGIEASADVTDAANVTSAGALMDSEVTNLAQVKAFDSSDYATAAQGTLATNALPKSGGTLSGNIDGNGNKVLFANVYSALSDLPSASTYHGMFAHVHAEGKAYYAHAGAWVPLANASQLASVGDGGLTQNNFTNALKSKLDGVAASANNYVHPNHSGEVTSTADGATVIANNVVDEANLKVSNDPTNGYVLTAQSGNTGGLTWAAAASGGGGIANVVEDTSPQLGADLQSNGHNIVFGDNDQAVFGAGSDLTIKSDGSNAMIQGAGTTYMRGSTVIIGANGGSGGFETGIRVVEVSSETSQVELYYDNSLKLETVSGGVTVTGTLAATAVTGDGSGLTNLPSSGGGADLYAANESSPSAQPSATGTNAVAVGDSAVASGYQAIALGNANASGEQSCAIGIRNNTTGYGSTGSYSFAQGRQAKAQGSYSVSFGRDSHASGTSSSAIGYQAKAQGNYAIGFGYDCRAQKTHSVALGSSTNANAIGKFAFGSGSSNTYGYAQSGMIVVAGRTANATTGVLVSDNATQSMGTADDDNQLYLEPFGAMAFDGLIVARGQGSASDTNSAAWKVEGLIRRENAASTTTLVNSAITVISNVPNWGLSLSADTSNGCLSVNVTGASSSNVKWVCTLRSSETIYNSY